jgi:hypothetical protein
VGSPGYFLESNRPNNLSSEGNSDWMRTLVGLPHPKPLRKKRPKPAHLSRKPRKKTKFPNGCAPWRLKNNLWGLRKAPRLKNNMGSPKKAPDLKKQLCPAGYQVRLR